MNRTSNKKQAGWIVGALASASLALGCGGAHQGRQSVGPLEAPSADNDGIGELTRPLMVPTTTECIFASVKITAPSTMDKGELKIVIPTTETLVLSKHALNGNFLLNGFEKVCDVYTADSTSAAGSILASKITAIKIDGAAGATGTTAVLDFANGTFGAAAAGASGSGVTVGATVAPTDLKIRTGASADKLAFGIQGANVQGDFDGKSPADILFSATPALTLNTGAGADTVDGNGPVAIFAAGATAFTSALTVYGAKGADIITGGDGADSLYGGEDNDTIKGGVGNDKLWGGKGNDTLHGQLGDDMVVGEEGSDTIHEGSDGVDNGSDRLYGWLNNDQDGDGIEDTQEATALPAIVSTSGTAFGAEPGTDSDTLTYAGRSNAVVVSPGTTTAPGGGRTTAGGADPYTCGANLDCFINTATTSELVADANDGESGEQDMVRGDFEVIIGTDHDDTFFSGPGDEEFQGGKGNDKFYATRASSGGADGADIFKGGDDTDTASYRSRTATVCVSIAASTSAASDANDGTPATGISDCVLTETVTNGALTVSAAIPTTGSEGDDVQSDVEVLEGGNGADMLVGNAKNNVLRGAGGNDVLVGLAGDDVLDEAFGGSPTDFTADNAPAAGVGSGNDALYGGAGTDTVSYASDCVGCYGAGGSTKARTTSICATINSVNDATHASWKTSGICTALNVNAASFDITFTPGTEADTIRMDVENLTGGMGVDLLTGNDKDNVLDGFGLPGAIPAAPAAQGDLAACGLGEGDTAYKATDVGYDNKNQPAAQADTKSCEF